MSLIDNESKARRVARTIASDLSIYNDEKVTEGIEKDNLFELLAEEIEEGRSLYLSRVSPELLKKNFFDLALVDILVRSKGHVASPMW